jgi:glycosyltransferase involved in cell wall biosynthesis
MAKILILIGAHLCTAPRPQKEAETLANAGHDVTVQGCWFDPELVKRDRSLAVGKKWRFVTILDLQSTAAEGRLRNLQARFEGRMARAIFQGFGRFSPALLGYSITNMLTSALKTQADLTIVHSEAGLWIGDRLLDAGFRVGVDFEDWFSEDLLPEDRLNRPIPQLKALESRLVRECKYCLTTSQSLAQALASSYQAPPPTVIYNAFPWSERQQLDGELRDRRNLDLPSIHWFSQTIGAGRGLEMLFQALPYIDLAVEIHLRGHLSESGKEWLEDLIPSDWRDRLFVHPTVPNDELLSRIAEHDIGLALEMTYCPSRQLTITNKLFQYLQAGIAVIATDTLGQREVFQQNPEIGCLIPHDSPMALAQTIQLLLSDRQKLMAAKAAALTAARDRFCWENQADRLLEVAELALVGIRG